MKTIYILWVIYATSGATPLGFYSTEPLCKAALAAAKTDLATLKPGLACVAHQSNL